MYFPEDLENTPFKTNKRQSRRIELISVLLRKNNHFVKRIKLKPQVQKISICTKQRRQKRERSKTRITSLKSTYQYESSKQYYKMSGCQTMVICGL